MTENVIWQPNKVSAKDRYRVLGQKGLVVWFTGLSGSGKSTIAVELEKMLNDAKKAVYLLFKKGIIYPASGKLTCSRAAGRRHQNSENSGFVAESPFQ